jgi:Zn-finger nucleic acid-binding protein
MSNCSNCSAPLPANINLCRYCGTRNDIDLLGKHQFLKSQAISERICPHCDIALQTIELRINGSFQIERCKSCFGLFFDPGEIDILLASSVANVFDINRELLENINKDRYQALQKVKYIKCPVCRQFMQRLNFGHRSGVIVDRCKSHGVWLDNGEITHLLEWKKAGGQMLHERQLKKKQHQRNTFQASVSCSSDKPVFNNSAYSNSILEVDLLESVASVIVKLFS